MNTRVQGWQIEPDASDEQAYQVLSADRIWNGYSIADLDPPYRAYTRIAVARHAEAGLGACLILQHPAFASIIPTGTPNGLAALLPSVEFPERTFFLAQPEHLVVLQEQYHFVAEPEQMIRMWVDADRFQPPAPDVAVEELGMADLQALQELYVAYHASSFHADQLATGPFYGVRENGSIIAAGGVHVAATRYSIAAIGNIFVLPHARGRGYGRQIAAAVVARLLATSCREVILNVAVNNLTARRLYTALGFQEHCRYYEGRVEQKATIR